MEPKFTNLTKMDYALAKKADRCNALLLRVIYGVVMLAVFIYFVLIPQIEMLSEGWPFGEIHWTFYLCDVLYPVSLVFLLLKDSLRAKQYVRQCMELHHQPFRRLERRIFEDHIESRCLEDGALTSVDYTSLKRVSRFGNLLLVRFRSLTLVFDLQSVTGGTADELVAFLKAKTRK